MSALKISRKTNKNVTENCFFFKIFDKNQFKYENYFFLLKNKQNLKLFSIYCQSDVHRWFTMTKCAQ